MIIQVQITKWHAQIGSLNGSASGRELRLSGTAQVAGLSKEPECEITFIKPSEADAMFSKGKNINHEGQRWFGSWKLLKETGGKLRLSMRLFLVSDLWNEIWERSKTPPRICIVSFDDRNHFDLVGEAGLTEHPTENPLTEPVFSFVSG